MSKYRKFEDVIGSGSMVEAGDDSSIVLPPDFLEDAMTMEPTEDGGVILYDPEPADRYTEIPEDLPFDANLADYISDSELASIGADIKEKVEHDIDSGAEWRETFNNGLKLLGFKSEDRDWVFKGASGAWDTKLLEAFIRFHSEIFPELFPADGPAKTKIFGSETKELIEKAARIRTWMNFYLTKGAPEYYDDSDQMLNYVLLAGSAFRKKYICPILNRPVAKYMTPNEVAMPYGCTGIWDAERFTHIADNLSPRDLKLLQLGGFYRDVDISPSMNENTSISNDEIDEISGVTKSISRDDEPYRLYETILNYNLLGFEHKDENGEETGLPLPYKVTLDAGSGTILRIQRNWNPKKQQMAGVYERKMNISHFKFMAGFGPFGIGLINCLGSSTESRTKIKRMLTDSGVFSNFPPTIRVKGMRMEHNHAGLRPGENVELDTGGMPVNNAIQQMNVREPSQMLKLIHDDDGAAADRIIGNTDISVGDGRQDAPVGTTMALLQAAKKPQNGVMRRLHRALTHELEQFYELFSEWLPDGPYPYLVEGGQGIIMKGDFDGQVSPTPVSDPNMMSQTERMMRSEAIMKITASLPPNAPAYVIEAARRQFVQMNVENVEKLLPPLPAEMMPVDPVTENQAAMTGKPLKAFPEQNHDAHIAVHTPIVQGNPNMMAHIQEHQAMKYRLMIEQQLGFQLPPPGTPLSPQVEQQVAILAAKATQNYMDAEKAKQPPPPPTMEQVMMADVEQKREKEKLRHQDAMAKIDAELKIQDIKSDDAAAGRAVQLQTTKLKTVANLAVETDKMRIQKKQPKTPPKK